MLNLDLKLDNDYKNWWAGYASSKSSFYSRYANNLLSLIEKYDIAQKTVLESFEPTLLEAIIEASSRPFEFLVF